MNALGAAPKNPSRLVYGLLGATCALAMCLVGCEKPVVQRVPRLAPDGTFYLVKSVSMTHEHGVSRYNEGTEVKFVEMANGKVRVLAGTDEIEATADCFTNDLDVRDALLAKNTQVKTAATEKIRQDMAEAEAVEARKTHEAKEGSKVHQVRLKDERISGIRQSISALEERISVAESELRKKTGSHVYRVPGSYSSSSTYVAGSGQTRKSRVGLQFSQDAVQIDQLRRQLSALRRHLNEVENSPQANR